MPFRSHNGDEFGLVHVIECGESIIDPNRTDEHDVDQIVVGSHGRLGVARIFHRERD